MIIDGIFFKQYIRKIYKTNLVTTMHTINDSIYHPAFNILWHFLITDSFDGECSRNQVHVAAYDSFNQHLDPCFTNSLCHLTTLGGISTSLSLFPSILFILLRNVGHITVCFINVYKYFWPRSNTKLKKIQNLTEL